MRLIHLSDPHLTNPEHPLTGRSHWGKRYLGRASWRRRRRFKHRREWLDALVSAVQAAEPDLILLTGDLAHIGLPEEIAEAADWLAQLGSPERVVLVPGNHDNYAADSWSAIVEHWGSYLHLERDYPICLDYPDLQLLGLSTALPTRPGSACGLAGRAQLAALDRLLSETWTRPRLLAIHHPPLPGMISFRKRLRDAAALQQQFSAHRVDLVLHGHGHHDKTLVSGDLRVYGVGSASYRQASFRCFDIAPQGSGWQIQMRLFRHEEPDPHGAFRCVEESSWHIAGVAG